MFCIVSSNLWNIGMQKTENGKNEKEWKRKKGKGNRIVAFSFFVWMQQFVVVAKASPISVKKAKVCITQWLLNLFRLQKKFPTYILSYFVWYGFESPWNWCGVILSNLANKTPLKTKLASAQNPITDFTLSALF